MTTIIIDYLFGLIRKVIGYNGTSIIVFRKTRFEFEIHIHKSILQKGEK